MGRIGLLVAGAWALSGVGLGAPGEFDSLVTPFVEQHCVKCHGEKKQKGDIRLDVLGRDFSDVENAVVWQDVADMLQMGDMPPEEEPRPAAEAISGILAAIDRELRTAASRASSGSRLAIRRLSLSALDNSVEDLLGIRLKLSENLPADPELEGFHNLAVTLDANPELILKLQDNANHLAQHAIVTGPDPRSRRVYRLGTIGHGHNVEEVDGFVVTSSSRDRKHVMWPKDFVVPRDGVYRVRVEGFARDNRWDLEAKGIEYTYVRDEYEKTLKTRKRKPNGELRLVAIVAIQASEARHMDAATVPGRRVGYFYFDDHVTTREVEVRLKRGENIMVHYASGAILNRSPIARVQGREMLVADLLHVKEIEVEGPLIDAWPPLAHRELLGDGRRALRAEETHSRIAEFLFRAFRRPVPEETTGSFVRLYEAGLAQGMSREEAMRSVVEGVLVSPRFLFNYDRGGNDAWALASRLSYFLWNSTPDDELLHLAGSGALLQPRVLRRQTRRMLADARAQRFVTDFSGQWLGLKDIELMRPDPKLYREYEPLLEQLLRRESELYFDQVLRKNLPVTAFLDSDWVMINERLAKHYGIEGVRGEKFRRVKLSANSPRGGLLGQGSILKLTSNGTRTSPVIRGVWVLENLFGDPPSPPPADVKPIEPDVRGTKTMFEMLARHREVETCNDCHRKIDPWGFGLEEFNAVGKFRTAYRNGQPIYAQGRVPGGSFDGVIEMKHVLLDRREQFTRVLTRKLFTYALGHPLTVAERITADDLAARNLQRGEGFRDLIVDICTSPLFRGELAASQIVAGN